MSGQPQVAERASVSLEIDGQPCTAHQGDMVIMAADALRIPLPRFCYHKKLPVAANCRMCLVEVEVGGQASPKPLPACATPVVDGMKVWTRSAFARKAQRAVMEFLLINHPLDCPICDQGGECELQDVSMGYGAAGSRFDELKRVVPDPDLGPLIATEMTRCIHCTRCIRTLELVGGQKELGATGRGEDTRIGTYIQASVDSEMSGNVIDVCPVGALTNKPFRFRARAWELRQQAYLAPFDAIGSNLSLHAWREDIVRATPLTREDINECWLSDRDRYACEGLRAGDRLTAPAVKDHGEWRRNTWDAALIAAVSDLKAIVDEHGPEQLGVLVSPTASAEELYLAQKLAHGLGCRNIDHRTRQIDFRMDGAESAFTGLGLAVAAVETLSAALLIGANPRKDAPILNHRLRKAAMNGAAIHTLDYAAHDLALPTARQIATTPAGMVRELAAIAAAAGASVAGLTDGVTVGAAHRAMAETLRCEGEALVLLGATAQLSGYAAELRVLAQAVAERTGAVLGLLPLAGNSTGARLLGVLPGGACADAVDTALAGAGLAAGAMLAAPRKAYVVVGLEPDRDFADPMQAKAALRQADKVLALNSFDSPLWRELADVLLPISTFGETAGTWINCEGRAQSVNAATKPAGEARPGWKVLRMLGHLLDLQGFGYVNAAEVRADYAQRIEHFEVDNRVSDIAGLTLPESAQGTVRAAVVGAYDGDAVLRRAAPLTATRDGATDCLRLSSSTAETLGVLAADAARVIQGQHAQHMPLCLDDSLAPGCVVIASGSAMAANLGMAEGVVEVQPV